jgi:predicted nucleic acid-binding protein
MKTYWDSSALLEVLHDQTLRTRLRPESDGTRPHSLAEIFSTLTKGIAFRYPPDDAAKMISDLAEDLDFIDLAKADALLAVKSAKRLGVRGARIHDLLHVFAARKYGADALMTLDTGGFHGIADGLTIQSP